ncbi:MAG: GTPase ObgE [Planctomycetes bacterium]|nr:GTPase ObgE [Planctomycetota bacterium]
MFVDRVKIEMQAGDGGTGCFSFRREAYVPRGGPDGGDGGDGGSIVVVAKDGINSLVGVAHRKLWKAKRGGHGSGSNRRGRNAEDLIIHVPPGTIVIDAEGGFNMKDLTRSGESVIAARGGKGGKGNARFKSATHQAPRETTPGAKGEHRMIVLELKVIADVGLIGAPNAGKSTMLSRLTKARPEIAAYPFTTKYPNLGRVQVDFDRSFVMADLPGLIEGAHEGMGLGHEFLRHIERAGILVHLVEPAPMDGSDPYENYLAIRSELVQYNEELGDRPEIVAVTKAELPEADQVRDHLLDLLDKPVLFVSAVTGQGLNQLTGAVIRILEGNQES